MKYLFKIFITCLVILLNGSTYGFEIERRREMFTKQYGHLFVPLPYSLPGLGEGLLFIGNFGNIADTTTDFATFLGVGDAERRKNHLGPRQRQASYGFRKVGIVAEYDPHLPPVDREHRIAGTGAKIYRLDTQVGDQLAVDDDMTLATDMGLAVFADDCSVRPD